MNLFDSVRENKAKKGKGQIKVSFFSSSATRRRIIMETIFLEKSKIVSIIQIPGDKLEMQLALVSNAPILHTILEQLVSHGFECVHEWIAKCRNELCERDRESCPAEMRKMDERTEESYKQKSKRHGHPTGGRFNCNIQVYERYERRKAKVRNAFRVQTGNSEISNVGKPEISEFPKI